MSVNFTPTVIHDNQHTNVMPRQTWDLYLGDVELYSDDEPPLNPDYIADADMNLNNSNARTFVSMIFGISDDDICGSIDIDEASQRCQGWLTRYPGPATYDPRASTIECMSRYCQRLIKLIEVSKQYNPTHISWA